MPEDVRSELNGAPADCPPSNLVAETDRAGRRYENEEKLVPRPKRELLREQMGDYVLMMLGAPQIDVELTPQQLSLCIDEALRVFEDYAPASFYQYHYFQTVPGQSRYRMPPDIGLIRQVYWRTGNEPCMSSTLLDGAVAIPHATSGMTDYYGYFMGYAPSAPIYGRTGEWLQITQYNEMYQRLASGNGGWEWGPENDIILYPNPGNVETVIVHYLQRMKDWPSVNQWMQEFALSKAKEIVGRIRSKYATIPGPNGGLTLDGQTLLSEAREDYMRLMTEVYERWGSDHMLPHIG